MIRKFKMTFDVNISLSTFGELENFPWIRPSDFLQAMAANGDFNKMLGGKSLKDCAPTLKEFWLRFQCLYPQHAVFQTNAATTDFSKYVPFYCHGDEGTGYKKKRCPHNRISACSWLWWSSFSKQTGRDIPAKKNLYIYMHFLFI